MLDEFLTPMMYIHTEFHRHNIAYGNLSASDDEVRRAAEMAELHHSILQWPNGYNTQVGVLIINNK